MLVTGICGKPEENDIAFRVFNKKSHSRFFETSGDIRCSNWQQFDINQPLERKHAEGHIEDATGKPTNYISISTSPLRLWNLVKYNVKCGRKDQHIAVIDLRVLRRLGIGYGSTTEDLKFSHLNKSNGTGTQGATKHHVLVLGWLPPSSILGFLSIEKFRSLLVESQIDTSS